MSTTPNMGLTLPTPSTTTGPQWANDINNAFDKVDSHDHTPGNGGLVPVAGLDINADLSFLGSSGAFSAIDLVSTRYTNQGANPGTERAIYARNDNLYWNTSAGAEVQITNGINVNAGAGSISGMTAPGVSVSFSSPAYTFQQAVNTPAVLDAGTVRIRDLSVGSGSIDLTSPSPSANYTLTFPATAPTAARLLGWSGSGLMNNVAADATLTLTASTIGIASLGVKTANIDNLAVGTAQIAAGAVTAEKMAAVNKSQTVTSGTVGIIGNNTWKNAFLPNGAVLTITTLRPIMLLVQSTTATGNAALISAVTNPVEFRFVGTRNLTDYFENHVSISVGVDYPPGMLNCLFTPSATGTWEFNLQLKQSSGTCYVANCILVAYQL